MPSIELLLDAAAERELRGEWDALAEAGLPSQARNTDESNRPHVTLLYSREPLQPTAMPGLPVELTVASPIVFGSARRGFLLARLVRANAALLAAHAALHDRLAGLPGIDRLTLPGAWTPHVTLARDLSAAELASALTLIEVRREVPAVAERARLWSSATRTVTILSPA